jgi:hypothetical protein
VVGSSSTGTTIPSDGEYDGEPDGDGYEITIGAAAGTIGAASGSESTIGAVVGASLTGVTSVTSVVGSNSTGLISGASIKVGENEGPGWVLRSKATSGLGCLVFAVYNMTTFWLEGTFSNG